jgi:hypothetical protein
LFKDVTDNENKTSKNRNKRSDYEDAHSPTMRNPDDKEDSLSAHIKGRKSEVIYIFDCF